MNDLCASLDLQCVEIAPGRSLSVGRTLFAQPRALFDAGTFGIYVDGANVVRALAERGLPAVSYTRAGLSGSGPLGGSSSLDRQVEDMLALLDVLGADGPTVLIGHSMAGLRLHRAAQLAPERVAGLVLVDAMVPGAFRPWALRTFAAALRPVERTLPAFCRTADAYPNAMQLRGRERADKLRSVYSADHLRATRLEVSAVARADVEADHGRPMVVMPAGKIARSSDQLIAATGARCMDMTAWGHASVLSLEPSAMIAEAALTLL